MRRSAREVLDGLAVTDLVYHDLRFSESLVVDILWRLVRRVPDGGRVLLVGGNHYLGAALLAFGYDLEIMTLGESPAPEGLEDRLVDRIPIDGPLPGPPATGPYEAIVMALVLEHLSLHAADVLQAFAMMLAPQGRVILAASHLGRLGSRLRALRGKGFLPDPRHLPPPRPGGWPRLRQFRLFELDELVTWSGESGYAVEDWAYAEGEAAVSHAVSLSVGVYLGLEAKHLLKAMAPGLRDYLVLTLRQSPSGQTAALLPPLTEPVDWVPTADGYPGLPMVSVVLSTQGASDRLSRSLRALFAQSYPAERYEVLVVHAGSDERLQHSRDEVVDRDQERLHLVSAAGLNAPAIRNTGLRRATGTVVAFTDDGCEVAPGWIEAGILGFERNVAVVTGPIKVTQGERPGLLDRAGGPQVAGALYPARNVFYRRDAALDAGGFDESFQPSAAGDRFWGWDSDLAWRLQRQGYEGRFRDAYAYVKPARSEFTPGLVQAWQIANATPRLVRAIPELRRHLLVGTVLYSWDNLAFKLGVLGTLLALGSRRTAWLLLWIPRVSRAIAIAGGDRWPPHRWPWLVGKVAILLALDTVSAVGLVRGSARARSVVL